MGKSIYFYFVLFITVVALSVHASDTDDKDDSELGYNIPGGKFRITDETELNDLVDRVKTHLKKLGDTQKGANLKLVRAKSAEYRVATGFIYTLVAEINENDDSKVDCTIELWEKPWLDYVKLDVECGDEKRKYQYKSREDPDDIHRVTPTTTSTTTPSCNTLPPVNGKAD